MAPEMCIGVEFYLYVLYLLPIRKNIYIYGHTMYGVNFLFFMVLIFYD